MDSDEIEDFLTSGYWDISPERPQTRKACREVLARLPEDLVEEIVYQCGKIVLLAPGKEWGLARPISFPCKPEAIRVQLGRKSRKLYQVEMGLVYLSPDLETESYPVIVAVVAHELAHALSRQIVDKESELLADNLIQQWGFGKELEALRAANPRHRY